MREHRALIIEENSWVPVDRRVWYEATTLRNAGWKVTVICPYPNTAYAGAGIDQRGSGDEAVLEGVNVYRFPLRFAESGMLSYIREYVTAFLYITFLSWKVWRKHGFDVLHVCNPPDIFFPLGLLYRLLGATFVFDHHDLFPEFVAFHYPNLRGKLLYVLARVTEYLTLRSANAVLSTNESYRNVVIKRAGVPAGRVVTVRNGPKVSAFVPVEPVSELKRGFTFMVCFVGMMGEQDGILEMLDVIRHIIQKLGRRDIGFALIGDGAARSRLLRNIASERLDLFVDMPGLIRDDVKLRQYISTADVCVSPEPLTPMNAYSTFIKVGEYMAMSKAVVAFDLCETRFTAQDAGCYVKPGDIRSFGQTIVDLLDDPERRRQIGVKGRQRILDELGWEHQAQHLFRAYALARASV